MDTAGFGSINKHGDMYKVVYVTDVCCDYL
nr:MAG TPA: hypothetical protein [Caudoviricetes sp.]